MARAQRSSLWKYASLPLPLVLLLMVACFTAGLFWSSAPEREVLLAQTQAGVARASRFLKQDKHASELKGVTADIAAQSQEIVEKAKHTEDDHWPAPVGKTGNPVPWNMTFQVLSWSPRAVLFRNFMDKESCEQIVAVCKKRMAPSQVAWRITDLPKPKQEFRTSSGTFITSAQDPTGALRRVEEKMAAVTMIPRTHGEAFNVLRYELGQKYESHFDTFDPAEYGPQASQRMASMLLYLTDVEEGGETIFPKEGMTAKEMEGPIDYKSCAKGLKVKPSQGDMLLFYSLHPDHGFDKAALHGGCPVIKGEKWVATKWVRDKVQFPE
eukprot:jgi/Chlat1/2713/Chrsp180S02878